MYGLTTTLTAQSFDEAMVNTADALQAEGFGILSACFGDRERRNPTVFG